VAPRERYFAELRSHGTGKTSDAYRPYSFMKSGRTGKGMKGIAGDASEHFGIELLSCFA